MRVMQSFGEPRPTTNPYIVMLRDSLAASDDLVHIPFSWSTALTGAYDVFHVHWPDTLLAGRSWATRSAKKAALALLIARLKLKRTPVVRTVHNVSEVSGPKSTTWLVAALNRQTTLRIHLNAATPELAGVPSVLIPHGHYREWYADMPRAHRETGKLGFVGLIKPYKGIDELVSAFVAARELDPSITLDIAGSPSDERVAASMRTVQDETPGLAVTLRYVDEEEFVTAVTRSTLVVLPYRFMHNSGSALAALSLDRPVLVPRNETNEALSVEVGAGWVYMFDGDLDGADLSTTLALAEEKSSGRPDLSTRGWTTVASQHADAYRRAITTRRGRAPARRHNA